jgi:zinc transport system substrate-binding protein
MQMICNIISRSSKMKKNFLSLSSFFCMLALLSATAYAGGQKDKSGKLSVVTSFDAMTELTKAVGGDKVTITTLTPAGVEPHEFEPKAQDMKTISKASVFVYNGFGMESWADKAIAAAANPKLIAVKASEGAQPITNTDPGEIKEHGQFDPHLWLSLSGAVREVQNIASALSKADPANAGYYEKNANAYTKTLDALRTEYTGKFAASKRKSFVTGHAAFAYFCRDFGLEQNSVEDVFAEGEPSAKQLAGLVDYCREKDVKTIFVEDMVSPEVSKTLADEIGATVKTIATIEGPEDGKTYLERQKENLEKIYTALNQ